MNFSRFNWQLVRKVVEWASRRMDSQKEKEKCESNHDISIPFLFPGGHKAIVRNNSERNSHEIVPCNFVGFLLCQPCVTHTDGAFRWKLPKPNGLLIFSGNQRSHRWLPIGEQESRQVNVRQVLPGGRSFVSPLAAAGHVPHLHLTSLIGAF